MSPPSSSHRRRLLALSLFAILGTTESFAPPTTKSSSSRRGGGSAVAKPFSSSPAAGPSFDVVARGRGTSLSMSVLDEATTQKLILLTFEKFIDAGVPAAFFVLSAWWVIGMVRGGNENEGRMGGGGRGGGGGMMGMMGMGMDKGGGGRKRRGGGGGPRGGMKGSERPLGPVEELYDDIYDDLSGPEQNVPPLIKLLGGAKGGGGPGGRIDRPTSKLNIGIPKQTFLKVTKLNSKYDSYRYSMVKATRGKAAAASELRARGFEDALGRALGVDGGALGALTPGEGTALLRLERDFLSQGAGLVREVAQLTREITNAAVLEEMADMGVEAGALDAIVKRNETTAVIDAEVVESETAKVENATAVKGENATAAKSENATATDIKKREPRKFEKEADIMRAVKDVEAINTEILLMELDFIQSVVEVLGPNRADAIRTAIVGSSINGETGTLLQTLTERPLATVLSRLHGDGGETAAPNGHGKKNLYVTRFPGDTSASQLNQLREEVTGILRSSTPGDEALLVLQSGGGTVTGYGLAAAQLLRFKSAGMKLTVCVEQVAASGGYMMCCTADRIVASPFSVLGSIGVISEVPNGYERLQREGIEFQTVTAGKYKRTVTPTKKITKEDLKKSEQDIGEIFALFKNFVGAQRPQLDIEAVATGETWFGKDALKRGLCDELATADDVLLEFVDDGYDVYEVAYAPTPEGNAGLLAGLPGRGSVDSFTGRAGADVGGWRGVFRSALRGIVSNVKEEVMAEMKEMNSAERRYMVTDDTADRMEMRD